MSIFRISPSAMNKLRILGRALSMAWRLRRGAVIGYMTGALMEIGGTLLTIYATAQLGGLLAKHIAGQPAGDIWFWLAVDVVAVIVISLGFWLMGFCQRLLYFAVTRWSTHEYMQKLCSVDYPDLYDEAIRTQINKVETGFSWMMSNLANTVLELCYGVLRLIAITIVVSQITWWLLPVIAIFLLPSLAAEAKLAQLQWFVFDDKSEQRHVFWNMFGIFKQARAQLEIRSQRVENYLTNKIDSMNYTFYQAQEKKFLRASKRVVGSKVLEAGGVAIGSIILITRFLGGGISFSQYLFLSGALLRVGGALNAVFGTLTRLQEPLLYAENFFAFVDRPIKMVDQPNAVALGNKMPPGITITDLSFTYPQTERSIFTGLNLTIKPGEHVAIVGENGAGKSTLIKLLLRFYSPTAGAISVNDTDLQKVQIASWYDQLATLFQDFNQYPFSVKENVTLSSNKSADSQKLQLANSLGGVDSIVENLPYGDDTILDSSFKRGVEPSGGQFQRIALSRAFYRNAQLLILDEPTAAIDAKAEYDIFNNIFDHYKDKTVVIVSHRFSTVRRADRIIVVDDGAIAEEGSHDELMKQQGLYHELFSKQAEGYR